MRRCRLNQAPIPRHRLPELESPPETAYRFIQGTWLLLPDGGQASA